MIEKHILLKAHNSINKWQIFQFVPSGKYGLLNRKFFEITEEQFSKFKASVLKEFYNHVDKLQFKDFCMRNKAYVLVDNSGSTWIPSFENSYLKEGSNKLNERKIIGNIANPEDWIKICSYLDKKIL